VPNKYEEGYRYEEKGDILSTAREYAQNLRE
jgi:hypothetical protein